jgi:hypothetical protein
MKLIKEMKKSYNQIIDESVKKIYPDVICDEDFKGNDIIFLVKQFKLK